MIALAEYTKIETAMAIICDLCGDLYLDDFCPEKNDSGKCGWRKYLEEDAADVEKMSDGYHTFADLYEQRLILSAALAKNNPHAWKSKRHADGSIPFGWGWFIMGFDTDEGCYTYHYELKDWDLFQCKELDKGKPWDGHTSKDVRRLLSIPAADVAPVVHGHFVHDGQLYVGGLDWFHCSSCGRLVAGAEARFDYCPWCGARMDGDSDALD